jgi:hypothetical protein
MRRANASRRHASDYARAIEAAACAATARIAIRFLSFRLLTRIATRRPVRPALTGAARARAIGDVRRAIAAAGARLPGTTPCFARAIAAQAMLRRRGVSSTLFYGATTAIDRRLSAHVWLRAGDEGVVGHEAAPAFALLATYSAGNSWIASTERT